MSDTWVNIPDRDTDDANASADINQGMINARVLGGNGTSAPDTDIQTIYDNIGTHTVTSGAGAPGTTPTTVGDIYIDTTGDRVYIAKGTASSADWEKQAKYEYGTFTLTGSGGDVTTTLDWDWTDGVLIIANSNVSTEYYRDDGGICQYQTTYDALTGGGYSSAHVIWLTNIVAQRAKAHGQSGQPKSATTTSFTVNDGDETLYMRWWVIA